MWSFKPEKASQVPARIGSLGVYATPALMRAIRRTRGERLTLTIATVALCWTVAPLAMFIPPHIESTIAAFLLGAYFGRRAWVGEWQVAEMSGTCPRCDHAITLKPATVLYLPHSLRCGGCRKELWIELEAAPEVAPEIREAARDKAAVDPLPRPLSARPLNTWSPAGSDWRDRPRA